MDPNTTIVRVKRKWGTDPADALLMACKRIRPEASATVSEEIPEPREEVENSVFKLVATVATQDAPVQTQLRQALFCDKSALCNSADISQCIIGDLSNTKWSSRQEDCFRLISSHRTALSTPAEQQNPHTDISQSVQDIAKEQDRRWGIGEILVVDLEQEQNSEKTLTPPERLCVFENGLGEEHHELEGEYVYDLYYQETATSDWIHDILPARVYDDKGQLVTNLGPHEEEEVYEELCEYEDNESEESNWKKDYSDDESDDDDSDREERDGGMSCAAHVFIWPLLTGCVVWLLPGWQF